MSEVLRAFCIGHVLPRYVSCLPYTMLCPKPLGIRGEIVIPDERFGTAIDGAQLAEYSQLFGLQDRLESGDIVADRLYLFQYRKFVGLRSGGRAANAPWLRVLQIHEADLLMPSLDELGALEYQLVVGSVFQLGTTVAGNYSMVHAADDFAAFATCLSEGGLDRREVRRFAGCESLIPSPAVCLIEVPAFLRQMRVLRTVWQVYIRECAVTRQGYQRRVSGYLLERLHSHLIFEWLMDGTQPKIGLGHRFAIVEDSQSQAVAIAPSEMAVE
jgi:hypothetical protein